ncbi:MAG TPA: periplasmic heavy metal sensor [Opitutaceae bacterium]
MRPVITFFVVVVLLACAAALGTRRLMDRHDDPSNIMLHRWLHDKLELTSEQRAAIEEIEADFAAEEMRLRANLSEANRQLAKIMREDEAYTPRVTDAVEQVHHAMGELQKLSMVFSA